MLKIIKMPQFFRKGQSKNDNNNYHFKAGAAYTEDNVLIYNVFAYKIPKSLAQEQLYTYFASFGELESVRFSTDKRRRQAPKVAFIHYVNSADASKILRKKIHAIQKKRFSLKACDSWYQPKSAIKEWEEMVTSAYKNNNNHDDTSLENEQCNILDLNDDCLEIICKKLDIHSQVKFARVCQRFRDIFEMSSKLEYKEFELDKLNGLTLWEARDFFTWIGHYIEKLTNNENYANRDRIYDFLSYSCPNVKSIKFRGIQIRSNYLNKLVDGMQMLTSVELVDCCLKDNSVLALTKLPQLEHVNLSDNYNILGKHLDKLENIKELNLSGCSNLQPGYLVEAFRHIEQLTSLNLLRCQCLSGQIFYEISVHCNKLLTLQTCCADVPCESIVYLPQLKKLELQSNSVTKNIRHQLFVHLSQNRNPSLECLIFNARNYINLERATLLSNLKQLKQLNCSFNERLNDDCLRKFAELENIEELVLKKCSSITNAGLLYLLRNCLKLKLLDIQRCSKITNSFVYDAIQLLKKQRQPNAISPLVCHVWNTSIKEQIILNEPRYIAARSYIHVSFEYPNCNFLQANNEIFFDGMDALSDDELFALNDANNVGFFNVNVYDDDDDDDDDDDIIDFNNVYDVFGRPDDMGVDNMIW